MEAILHAGEEVVYKLSMWVMLEGLTPCPFVQRCRRAEALGAHA